MNKKRILAGFLTAGVLMSLAACGNVGDTKGNAQTDGKDGEANGYSVSYINLADSDVNCRSTKEFFEQYSKDYPDMSVSYFDTNNDIEQQVFGVETAIAQKANAIIVLPADANALASAVEQANSAQIPVIAFRGIINSGETIYVGSENYDSGYMQGEYLAEKLQENAKILYLAGTAGMQHSVDRREGLVDALKDAGRDDVTILADQDGDYLRDEAMSIMEDWMQTFSDFNAVAAANDEMALGAVEALKGAQKLDGVLVVGVDGNNDALQAIKSGEMAMTAYQNAQAQAQACAEVADKLARGETAEDVIVPFEKITIDNVNKYLS